MVVWTKFWYKFQKANGSGDGTSSRDVITSGSISHVIPIPDWPHWIDSENEPVRLFGQNRILVIIPSYTFRQCSSWGNFEGKMYFTHSRGRTSFHQLTIAYTWDLECNCCCIVQIDYGKLTHVIMDTNACFNGVLHYFLGYPHIWGIINVTGDHGSHFIQCTLASVIHWVVMCTKLMTSLYRSALWGMKKPTSRQPMFRI